MTKKASEPRLTMKIPLSFRDKIRQHAQKKGLTMMEYVVAIVTTEMDKETV